MILHLERKFTSPTETFIVNQINALHTLEHSVFTIEHLNFLSANATILSPPRVTAISTKLLKRAHKNYFDTELEKMAPQIIHGHYITDSIFFHPITKNSNIPKICSCYGYDVSVIPRKYGFLAKYFYNKIFKEYDLFLAMTNEMKKDLIEIGCPESKIKVHYHGINTKLFEVERDYDLKEDTLNLLTIASLLPVKGHMSVLRALRQLSKNIPDLKIKYNIVGEGFHQREMEYFIKENGISDCIIFHGAEKHGPKFKEFLKQADIFIHPSITTKQNDKEGIPGAIVEAMASGLPVIATWHGGIPSVISDGTTGFLVKENDFDHIANEIVMLYKDMELRKTIGENAKNYAQKHLDLFEKAKDLEEIYNSVIRKKASMSVS